MNELSGAYWKFCNFLKINWKISDIFRVDCLKCFWQRLILGIGSSSVDLIARARELLLSSCNVSFSLFITKCRNLFENSKIFLNISFFKSVFLMNRSLIGFILFIFKYPLRFVPDWSFQWVAGIVHFSYLEISWFLFEKLTRFCCQSTVFPRQLLVLGPANVHSATRSLESR